MSEISIYHPPGEFIYTVWDEKGKPLYVGGTKDIMAKSFKFDFPYADITGEYWRFPGGTFESEIDRRIALLKPKYNTKLRTSMTKTQLIKYFRALFKAYNLPFTKREKNFITQKLCDISGFEFQGEFFYLLEDRGILEEIIREEYGIRNI